MTSRDDDETHPRVPGGDPRGEAGAPPPGGYPALTVEDGEAVDLLVEHGFDLEAALRAAPAQAERLRAAHAVFFRLESYDVGPSSGTSDPALVDATLARIAQEDDARRSRMRLDGTGGVARLGSERWRDVLAVACAAILILSIGMPIANQLSGRSRDASCGANLRDLGMGIAGYVKDNDGLPMAAGFSPDLSGLASWSGLRNRDNLKTLAERGYCSPGCLCCAADATGEGYAYQVPTRSALWRWQSGERGPLVADRNPVIDLFRSGRPIGTFTMNSPEHGGRGQNVLFTDGSIEFARSPILIVPASAFLPSHAENIWIPMDSGKLEDGFDAPREWIGFDVFLTQ